MEAGVVGNCLFTLLRIEGAWPFLQKRRRAAPLAKYRGLALLEIRHQLSIKATTLPRPCARLILLDR